MNLIENLWDNITKSLLERKGQFTGLDEKQLTKVLERTDKGKSISVSKPTSYRTQNDNGEQDVGLTSGEAMPVESSAIQDVSYDPERNVASITFVGGNKSYNFDVIPDEMKEFLTAPSKGQWVNNIWKYNNRMSGY